MTGRRLAQLAAIPVGQLKGVGDKKVEALAAMEIHTVLDLLTHYPRRYVDRTRQSDIADLTVGDEAVVLATVKRVKSRRTRQGRMIVEVDVFDGTSYLHVVFFNQGWRAKQLGAGTQAVFFGKLEKFRDRRQMTNP
ncbi:MAG TPA: DNA helicase RecG, partial [Acidimicrobiales bacterium]